MADIINSVDRSLDMYIYDLYIYRYISLSIYRSIFLYLFWLADIFASVERPDNKSLHLADMILVKLSNLLLGARQHHTTSGSVLFFALAAHGRKVRKPAVPGSTPGKKKNSIASILYVRFVVWVSMKSGLSFQSQRTSSSDMPFHHHDYHHQIYNRACSLNLDVLVFYGNGHHHDHHHHICNRTCSSNPTQGK